MFLPAPPHNADVEDRYTRHVDYLNILSVVATLFIAQSQHDSVMFTTPVWIGMVDFTILRTAHFALLACIMGALTSSYFSVTTGGLPLVGLPTVLAVVGLLGSLVGWTARLYITLFDLERKSQVETLKDSRTLVEVTFGIHCGTVVLLIVLIVLYIRYIQTHHTQTTSKHARRGAPSSSSTAAAFGGQAAIRRRLLPAPL